MGNGGSVFACSYLHADISLWPQMLCADTVCVFICGALLSNIFARIDCMRCGTFWGCVYLCVRVWQVFCVTTHHPSSQMGEWQEEQKQIPRSGENKRVMPTNDKCLLCACESGRWRDACACVFLAVRIRLCDCVGEIEREKDKANECWETQRRTGWVFSCFTSSVGGRAHILTNSTTQSELHSWCTYCFYHRMCSHTLWTGEGQIISDTWISTFKMFILFSPIKNVGGESCWSESAVHYDIYQSAARTPPPFFLFVCSESAVDFTSHPAPTLQVFNYILQTCGVYFFLRMHAAITGRDDNFLSGWMGTWATFPRLIFM